MFPLVLKAADDLLTREVDFSSSDSAETPVAGQTNLFPYDEQLDEALSTLLSVVNQNGTPEARAAFGDFLGYVERLEKTIKHHHQHQSTVLTWVETGTITLN